MVLENKKHVVPRLDYFENQGVMTGSKEFPRVDHMIDEFRYKLETVGESIKGYVWHGPYCYNYCRDNGQIKAEAEFPLTNEGTDEIFHWLEEMYLIMKKVVRKNKPLRKKTCCQNGNKFFTF